MSDKADLIMAKRKTAMQKAIDMKDKMNGRLLKNKETGAIFRWSPTLSLKNELELLSEDEQAKREKEFAANEKKSKK